MEEPQRRPRPMLSRQLSTTHSHLDLPPPASAGIAASSSSSSSSSSNLRGLLTVRQDEDLHPLHQRRGVAGVSLGTALACEKRDLCSPRLAAVTSPSAAAANPAGGSRTLFDIIRDEESGFGGGRAYDDGVFFGGIGGGHKISWRAFKDRLRIRRAGAAWQSTAAAGGGISASDLVISAPLSSSGIGASEGSVAHVDGPLPEPNPSSTIPGAVEAARPPTPAPAAMRVLQCGGPSAVEQEQGGSNPADAAAPATATSGDAQHQQQQQQLPPPQQIRVSLMALLEQTDRQGDGPGFAVSALLEAAGEAVPEEEEDEEEEDGGGGGEGGKMYVKCCVCMVRHKGAAFIPCGHTFCRLCSRELWVSRGNCPLCNGFILEILDIF